VTRGEFAGFVRAQGYRTETEKAGMRAWGIDPNGDWKHAPEFTWRNPGFAQTDRHPVAVVSWNDAVAFCEWLAAKEGRTYRLPTEAEWEYACRAGTTTRFHSGNDPDTLADAANVADAAAKRRFPNWKGTINGDDAHVFTAPVGQFQANAFGLCDMHGNVLEWCQDWYDAKYYPRSPRRDPPGPAAGDRRVIRGGAFLGEPRLWRAARGDTPPHNATATIGFRVVLEP
jgi:formylglycine-generating enzyme required for sulfatase activity